jgi:hypothetical protein
VVQGVFTPDFLEIISVQQGRRPATSTETRAPPLVNSLPLSHHFALTTAFVLLTPSVRADLITPDSITNPPAAVGSADGAPIPSAANLVTTQYAGLGLNFLNSGQLMTAITTLNGVKVWVPGSAIGSPPFVKNPPVGAINYSGLYMGGGFVLPGTLTRTTASSFTLEMIGGQGSVDALDSNGQLLGAAYATTGKGPHGGQMYTFTGPGISSFTVFHPILDPIASGIPSPAPWGVAEIEFTPSTTPEPGSLLLAGLGALGLAIRSRWRTL